MHEEVLIQSNKKFILPQKALIVFPDFIGDSIILTAFLRNFRYNLSKGAIVHVCANKAIADMLDGNPHVDAVFVKNKIRKISDFLNRQSYDTAIILDFSLAWSFHVFKSNIGQKVITDMKRANLRIHKFLESFFTHVLLNTSIKDKTPQIEVYLDYLRQLGLKIFDRHLEVKVDFEDINVAKKLIKKTKKRKIFLHLGASIYSKKWPLEYWQEIVEYLKKDELYIIGSDNPSEVLLEKNVTNLCSKTSLKQTIALLYNADVLITTDSAPAHLAAVAKVPNIIVLYGPTNYHQWRPYAPNSNVIQLHANMDCNPCNLRVCKSLKCLKELKPQMVIDVIDKIKSVY
ncbi:MAG: glycosyltransferase family 9 protein [bacterium]